MTDYFIIIHGPLGCGKTTVVNALVKKLGAKCFHVDGVLEEHRLTNDREDGYISQKSFLKVNEIIVPVAMKLLNDGVPVIFDGNFYWKSQIEDLINRLDFPHYVFTLKAPVEVCIARDKQRTTPHGTDAVRAVYDKTMGFEYGIAIDATQSTNECMSEIISCLSQT